MAQTQASLQRFDAQFDAIRSMPVVISKDKRRQDNLTKVLPGGFLTLDGKTYKVVGTAKWGGGSDASTELELYCLNDGSQAFLEWWKDLVLNANASRTRLTLKDLRVLASDLEDIAEEGRPLNWNSLTFEYDDDFELTYSKAGAEEESAYIYSFRTSDGKSSLSLQVWGEEGCKRYDAWVSETVNPADVEILVLAEN